MSRITTWRRIGSETCLKEGKSAISGAGPSTGPMLRSGSPALIAREHAAWVIGTELARAVARAAAAIAVPAGKGRRAGQLVHPREYLVHRGPPRGHHLHPVRGGDRQPARRADRGQPRRPAGLARRRVVVDRDRHRDRKTKARLGFPAAGGAWPPPPQPPGSASASQPPPDPLRRPAIAGPWSRPPAGSDSRATTTRPHSP